MHHSSFLPHTTAWEQGCNSIYLPSACLRLQSHFWLVSEPDPSQYEEGSGHSRASELSPGQNVDLTNQNRWLQITSWKWFFFRLSVPPRLDTANCCAVLCFTRILDESWGEATSRSATNVRVVSPQIA